MTSINSDELIKSDEPSHRSVVSVTSKWKIWVQSWTWWGRIVIWQALILRMQIVSFLYYEWIRNSCYFNSKIIYINTNSCSMGWHQHQEILIKHWNLCYQLLGKKVTKSWITLMAPLDSLKEEKAMKALTIKTLAKLIVKIRYCFCRNTI